ncbi:MAG: M20 family metallo-hydrolase [Planctomycetota bacterium]|jgi:succinyl-diaminopimelate desuccinylase
MAENYNTVARKIDSYTNEMVDFQKAITAVKALSPKNGGNGEFDKSEHIKNYLKSCGITDIQEINVPDKEAKNSIRPNLIAKIPGKSEDKLWIMAHTDVVPTGDLDLWDTDPWEVVEKDGKLFGRGVEDNQQGLTSALFAAKAFIDTGIKPERTIYLIFCADEETGSEFGLDYIVENYPDLFSEDDIIIVPDAGSSDSTMIEVAEKTLTWVKFKVHGKQCHASMPQDGINASRAAADLTLQLEKLYEIFDENNPIFLPPYSTFEPTMKKENVPNVNTIPAEDTFYMDMRVLPCYTREEVLAEIEKMCREVEERRKVKIDMSIEMTLPSSPATPDDAEVVKLLQAAIKEVYKKEGKPMGIGGGTVAASFRKQGLPAAVWCTMDQMAHQPNEYSVISNMVNDAKVFAHVALAEI